jgi:hypothetical protein
MLFCYAELSIAEWLLGVGVYPRPSEPLRSPLAFYFCCV